MQQFQGFCPASPLAAAAGAGFATAGAPQVSIMCAQLSCIILQSSETLISNRCSYAQDVLVTESAQQILVGFVGLAYSTCWLTGRYLGALDQLA